MRVHGYTQYENIQAPSLYPSEAHSCTITLKNLAVYHSSQSATRHQSCNLIMIETFFSAYVLPFQSPAAEQKSVASHLAGYVQQLVMFKSHLLDSVCLAKRIQISFHSILKLVCQPIDQILLLVMHQRCQQIADGAQSHEGLEFLFD